MAIVNGPPDAHGPYYDTNSVTRPPPRTEPTVAKTFHETGGEATSYTIALDLGQARDWSAVVVNQRVEGERIEYRQMERFDPVPVEYRRRPLVRHNLVRLHRYPLGTSYPEIARSIRDVMRQLPPMAYAPELIVDATGVGRPVVDQLRELGLHPKAATITGGFGVSNSGAELRIAKKALASILDVVLSERRLKVPTTEPLASVLVDELRAFTVRTTSAGNETFAALRERDHDDLVLATALAVWAAEKRSTATVYRSLDAMAQGRGLILRG